MLRVTVSGLHALMATHALLAALAEQPVLHYERQPYQVLSANLARSPLSSVRTWADLLAASPSTRPAVCLRFITPTIFTTPADGSAQGECFPQPLQVFSRLLARWNWLGGPALPPGILSWLRSDACLVTDYRLRAGPIPAGGACEPTTVCLGWQGWVAYACREPQSEFMASLQALARLACFTGVGDRTEVGLGMTQIVESR